MRLPLILCAVLVAMPAVPATPVSSRPYHLTLQAYPAGPFPFLSRFGTVTIDVYPGGVRADTFWLDGFSSNRSTDIVVENPLARMYVNVPVDSLTGSIRQLGADDHALVGTPYAVAATRGAVKGIPATRYRLQYGPKAWLDLWTTDRIPENSRLRLIEQKLLDGISPGTAETAKKIPGTPLFVELNFNRFKKVALLRTVSLVFNSQGEAEALKVGAIYMKAPLSDAIWK